MSSQVVPVLNQAQIDEENIRSIAMSLSNPSPFISQEKFEFPFDATPRSSANFSNPFVFSPSIANAISFPFTTPSSAIPASSSAAFAFSGNPCATPQATMTQVAGTAPAIAPAVAVVKMEEVASSSSAVGESDESDQEEEEPVHEEDRDAVPSADESEDSYDSRPAKRGRKRKQPQAVGSHVRTFSDLKDDEIAFMDFKELTRLMIAAGLSRADISEVKARRRRLKNRQSARLCSNKKRELCQELQQDKDRLQEQLTAIQGMYAKLQREFEAFRSSVGAGSSSKRSRDA